MAVSANAVFELRIGGSDTNGGGFVTGSGGTDYSQQDAAQLSVTDAACTGNTTVTSATGGFTAAMVGSIMYLSSGPGWYQITARTDTNTITIDRNGPNATGMTANVGGALATTGGLGQVMTNVAVDGTVRLTYQKYSATAYAVTTTSTNVSGGALSLAYPANLRLVGYDSTRTVTNTDANRPTVKADAALGACTLLSLGVYYITAEIRNLIVDGSSRSGVNGILATGNGYGATINCEVFDCAVGISANNVDRCNSYSNSSYGFSGCNNVIRSTAYDNGASGFYGCVTLRGCVSYRNTGGSSRGFYECQQFDTCISYDNGHDGFALAYATRGGLSQNLISYGNTGKAFEQNSLNEGCYWVNCAAGDNTSGDGNAQLLDTVIALTADPFVDAASDDFNLNNTSGGGAVLRAITYDLPG